MGRDYKLQRRLRRGTMVPSYGEPLRAPSKAERKALKAKHRQTPRPQELRIGTPAPERSDDEIAGCHAHVLFAGAPPAAGARRMTSIQKAHILYPTAPPVDIAHVLNDMIAASRKATSDLRQTPLEQRVRAALRVKAGVALCGKIAGTRGAVCALDIAVPKADMRAEMDALLASPGARALVHGGPAALDALDGAWHVPP